MGTEKIISNEDAQIKIADKFITWGWKDKKQKRKVVPFYSILISNIKKKYNYTKAKDICFCQNIYPNYFAHLDGNPITFTDKIYFIKKANEVFNNLNSSLKKEYVIRYLDSLSKDSIYHPAFINNKIRKDRGDLKLEEILQKVRIFVHDQDSTTFLKTLSYNIPTLLILKKNYYKNRRKESRRHYLGLEKVKILHTDPISLSNFINKNYYSIEKWWNNEKTQKARNNFCKYYAKKTDKPVQSVFSLIKKI
jgi:putative transferase (TIGR04331 family)